MNDYRDAIEWLSTGRLRFPALYTMQEVRGGCGLSFHDALYCLDRPDPGWIPVSPHMVAEHVGYLRAGGTECSA